MISIGNSIKKKEDIMKDKRKKFAEYIRLELNRIKDDRNERISKVIQVLLLVGVIVIHKSDFKESIWIYVAFFCFLTLIEILLKHRK